MLEWDSRWFSCLLSSAAGGDHDLSSVADGNNNLPSVAGSDHDLSSVAGVDHVLTSIVGWIWSVLTCWSGIPGGLALFLQILIFHFFNRSLYPKEEDS